MVDVVGAMNVGTASEADTLISSGVREGEASNFCWRKGEMGEERESALDAERRSAEERRYERERRRAPLALVCE